MNRKRLADDNLRLSASREQEWSYETENDHQEGPIIVEDPSHPSAKIFGRKSFLGYNKDIDALVNGNGGKRKSTKRNVQEEGEEDVKDQLEGQNNIVDEEGDLFSERKLIQGDNYFSKRNSPRVVMDGSMKLKGKKRRKLDSGSKSVKDTEKPLRGKNHKGKGGKGGKFARRRERDRATK